MDNYERAEHRVLGSDALYPHIRVLLYTDWPNWAEHLDWVSTAAESEIVDWCLELE